MHVDRMKYQEFLRKKSFERVCNRYGVDPRPPIAGTKDAQVRAYKGAVTKGLRPKVTLPTLKFLDGGDK